MKKFLTVLLVIAVMFTFSFGSAMAATHKVTSTTEATTLAQAYEYAKGLVATNYAKAYEEAVEVNLGYEVSKADWDAIATQAAVEGFLAEKYNKAMNEFDDAWTALDYKHLAAAVFASSQDTRLSVGGNAVVSEYASYGADTAQVVVTAIKNVLINEFGVEVALRAYEADRQEVLSAFDKVNYAAYSDKVDPAVGNTQKLTYRQEAEEIVKAAKKATAEVGYFTTDTYTELVNGNLAAILNSIKTSTTEFSIFGGANVKGVAYYLEKEMYKGYETGNYLVKAVKTASAVEGEDAADAATIAANKAKIAKIYANYVATNNANKDWADAWKTVADFLAEQEALPAGWLDTLDATPTTLGTHQGALTSYSKAIDNAKTLALYGDKYAAEKDSKGVLVRDPEDVADEVETGTLNIYNVLFTTGLESDMVAARNVAEARILALSISDDAAELAFKKESAKTILNDALETALDDYYPLEADMVKAAYEEVLAKVEAAKTLAAVPTVNLPAKAVKKNVVDGYCTYTTGTPEAAALAAVKAYVDYANSAKTALDGTYIPWDTNAQDTAKDLIEEIYGEAGARTATARKAVSIDGAEIAAKLPTVSGLAAAKKAAEDAIKALPKASAVELADKDVIVAAWELARAYDDMAGVNTMVTSMSGQLGALKTAIKNDLTKQLALADQTDKTALRAIDDNVTAFKDMMKEDQALETVAEDYTLAGLSTAIDKVKTTEANAVKTLIAKIPVNVTEADKATVQAARAAYDAYVADWTDYFDFANGYVAGDMGAALRTLLLAEASLGLNYDAEENAKAYVQDLKIAARSVKTSKGVKVTIKADVQELLDAGFTVEYKFYRSTKSNKNFGTAKVTKTENTYLNTAGKKGTKYYYKAKLVVKNAEGEVVATTPLTQCLYATRTF